MGFFNLKVTCAICNEKVGLNRWRIADKKWVCSKCAKKAGYSMFSGVTIGTTVSEIEGRIAGKEKSALELNTFSPTKKVGTVFEIDEIKKQWVVLEGIFVNRKNSTVYNFSDISSFELLEDGSSITKGGLGSAIAGGLLFGGVGAIVGGLVGSKKNKAICNNLSIKITLKNMSNPVVYIKFIRTETKKDSFAYKTLFQQAQECLSILQLMYNEVN